MTIQEKFIQIYGNPVTDHITFERKFMTVFFYPETVQKNIPVLGKSIYCNINFTDIYTKFLLLLIERNLHNEIKTNDECYNVRNIRGTVNTISIHSFGMAVDLNAKDNPIGMDRETAVKEGLTPFTSEFIQTSLDTGLIAGYNFGRKDGMHFENTN